MLNTTGRTVYDQYHNIFRDTVRKVFAKEIIPVLDAFEEKGCVSREAWQAVGAAGLLCPSVSERYGGQELDYGYNAVVAEELAYAGSSASFTLQNDITVDYFTSYGTQEQREKYLPGMVAGEIIAAIAMTEPGTGSDLQSVKTTALRDGDHYVLNGSKTYITNGQLADVVIVVAKTDPQARSKGISLILVDADMPGFSRGRNLDKIGQKSADTSELFFQDVRVPASNLLGGEGRGFVHLMSQLPQERLSIAVSCQASAQRAFDEAVSFVKERPALARPSLNFRIRVLLWLTSRPNCK